MTHKPPPLRFPYDAWGPQIDAQTVDTSSRGARSISGWKMFGLGSVTRSHAKLAPEERRECQARWAPASVVTHEGANDLLVSSVCARTNSTRFPGEHLVDDVPVVHQTLAVVMGRRNVLNQFVVALAGLGLLGSGVLMGCEKGPAEKVGEQLDKALDKLSGKGPLEKAGERIDQAVDTLNKK